MFGLYIKIIQYNNKFLFIVGTVASAISAFFGYHEIKSVPYIILYETTPEQREKLALSIVKYLNLKNIWSLRDLLYYNKEELALGITSIIVKFVTHDMRYSMRNWLWIRKRDRPV